jgi:YD repeat-containing protein
MASVVDVHRAGIVRGLIASVAAVALVLSAPDGSASGSSPSPQAMQFASGLGPAGVVPDVGLGWSAPGVRRELDRPAVVQLARPRGDALQADASKASSRGHGFARDARGFATIDAPNASVTTVTGSDGHTRLVGSYRDAWRGVHGFLRDRRHFRRIDVPGAEGTAVWKINARGQMVGTYTDERDTAAQFFEHGFLLDRRGLTRFDLPGAVETRPFAINNRGQIAGEYLDRAGRARGFLRDRRGAVTKFDAPGATVTAAFDLDDDGRAVGIYVDASAAFHGFVREPDGAITTVDFPGAGDTELFGINNRGQVTGAQRKAGEGYRGFVARRGEFTAVDVPGARGGEAAVNDTDDRGRLVGDYDVVASAYLRDERGRLTTFDAPGALTQTVPIGLNNRGQIVGSYDRPDGPHGFMRDERGRFTTIDFPGAQETEAARINDRGQIVGIYGQTDSGSGGFDPRGFLFDRGEFTAIDLPDARSTSPSGIDNAGRIAGSYVDVAGAMHGFVRDPDGAIATIDVPGAVATQIVDLNDRGETAGLYVDAEGVVRGFRRDQGGTVTTIARTGATPPASPSIALGPIAYGINNRGQVVGAYRDDQFQIYGFQFDDRGFSAIRPPGARGESYATDIDDRGRIIGLDR